MLLPNNQVGFARSDGAFVVLDNGEANPIPTLQPNDFLVSLLPDDCLLFAGHYLTILDTKTGIESEVTSWPFDWGRSARYGDTLWIVGEKGRLGIFNLQSRDFDVIQTPVDPTLMSVCVIDERNFLVGGWRGQIKQKKSQNWEDLSIPTSSMVTDISTYNGELYACCDKLYKFNATNKAWSQQQEAGTNLGGFEFVDGYLLVYTYDGEISILDGTKWEKLTPSAVDAAYLLQGII